MCLTYAYNRSEAGNARQAVLVLEVALGEGLVLVKLQDTGCPTSAAQTPQSTTEPSGAGFSFPLH